MIREVDISVRKIFVEKSNCSYFDYVNTQLLPISIVRETKQEISLFRKQKIVIIFVSEEQLRKKVNFLKDITYKLLCFAWMFKSSILFLNLPFNKILEELQQPSTQKTGNTLIQQLPVEVLQSLRESIVVYLIRKGYRFHFIFFYIIYAISIFHHSLLIYQIRIIFISIGSLFIYLFVLTIFSMVSVFVVRHQQPKDIPFAKSSSLKQIQGKKYYNTCKLTLMVFIIFFSTFYYGLCLTMISAVSPKALQESFGPWAGETATIGLLIGFFPIGGAIGAITSKIFLRFFTRKQSLIIIDVFVIITTGLLQIPNIGLLLALRIIQGIIVGVFMAIVPLYMNQLVPLDLHGSEGVISQVLIVFGYVINYILKVAFTVSQVNLEFSWRFIFGFSGIPCLVQMILLIINYIPESPMSLVQNGKMDEARQVLGMFNIPEVLNDVLAEMIYESKKQEAQNIVKNQDKSTQSSDKKSAQEPKIDFQNMNSSNQFLTDKLDKKSKQTLSMILSMYHRYKDHPQVHKILSDHHIQYEPVPQKQKPVSKKALFIGFQLHIVQQFSGIKMVITEVGVIFTQYNPQLSLYSLLVSNVVQLIATCISSPILYRFGRKNPTLAGNLGLCILNFIIAGLFLANAINQNIALIYTSFAFIILFMIVYALTLGPIVWPYVPELIPTRYIPYTSIVNWISAAICTIVTPYILNSVGSPYPVFFFFGVISLICFIINLKVLVETKGLTPTQIAEKLSK